MLEKTLNRIMAGAKTPEGKIVAILLTLSLALMTWNATSIKAAFATDEGQDVPAEVSDVMADDATQEASDVAAEELATDEVAAPEPAVDEADVQEDATNIVESDEAVEPSDDEGDQADEAAANADEEAEATDEEANSDAEEADEAANEEADAENEEEVEEEIDYPAKAFDPQTVNGVTVNVAAPAGALPEGTELVVTAVSASQVVDQINAAVEDEITADNIQAVDITFMWTDPKTGETAEVQPKVNVSVRLASQKIAEANADDNKDADIVHIADNGEASVVPSSGTAVNEKIVITSDFSIYAIVEGGDTHEGEARRTYEFLNVDDTPYEFQNTAGAYVTNQILKNGEALQEVGIPDTGTDEKKFNGWYYWDPENETYGTQVQFNTAITGIDKTETVYIKANANENRYVTFYEDPQGGTILTRDQAPLGTQYDISTQSLPAPVAGLVFVGWSTEKSTAPAGTYEDDRTPVTTTTVTVNDDLVYYPVFKSAHWLTFVSAKVGQGASYIPSQFVLVGQKTEKPSDPTYTGYTFVNWSTTPHQYDANGNITNMAEGLANPFTFGNTIDEDTMLYAYYNDAQTNYTIVYWKQNVTDAKDATDANKTYSYFTMEEATGTAHQTANIPASATNKASTDPGNFTGFKYNANKTDTSITVEADGSSIMNVYYDRELVTMQFYATNNNSAPSGGYNSNVWTNGTNVTTYTGLYGQTLAQNGYSWPAGVWTYYATGNDTRGMSYLGQFVLPDSVRDSNNLLFRAYRTSNNPNQEIRMYLEQPDGSYVLDASGYANNAGTFYFSEKYDGYTVSQYRRHSSWGGGSWGNWANAGTSVSIDGYDILEVRYNLKSYTLHFLDPVDNSKVLDDVTVKYSASLASYVPTEEPASTHPGKEFSGKWYADAACSTEFDFANSTMPNADVNVYAGWEDIWYLITVDPNGGEITQQTGGATWFWETYGELVEEYPWVQRDYVEDDSGTYYYTNHQYADPEPADRYAYYSTSGSGQKYKFEDDAYKLVGWYDKDTGQPYQFSAPVTKDTNLIAQWRRVGEYHLVYDVGENGVAGSGPIDGNGYADRSATSVLGNPTPKEGYVFAGWEYKGEIYHTGDAITVDASLADADKNITIKATYTDAKDQKVDVTHITWNGNNKDTFGRDIPGVTSPTQWTKSSDDVPYNEGVPIEGAPDLAAYADYTFLGWAKVAESASAPYAESDLFLTYSGGSFTVGDDKKPTSEVGADESQPYETLYAIWAPNTYTVTITKTVVGGDDEAPFNFDATFSNAGSSLDGTQTFTLVGAESATVEGVTYTNTKEIVEVPAGAKLTVAEHEEDLYTTKFKVGDGEVTDGTSTGELTIEADTTIAYTNTLKSITVDPTDAETTFGIKNLSSTTEDGEGHSFSFTLADGGNTAGVDTPMPEETTVSLDYEAAETGEKTMPFGEITYDKAGTYNYTITEDVTNYTADKGWTVTYSPETKTVTVDVAFDKESGKLKAEVSGVTIENAYDPEDITVDPTDTKTTFGIKNLTATTEDGEGHVFEFALAETTPDVDSPLSETKTVEYEADETGKKTIPFSEITYSEVGDYTYTITETVTDYTAEKGWTVKNNGGTVTVTVTDNGQGKLEAEVTGVTIENAYKHSDVTVDPTETVFGTKSVEKAEGSIDFDETAFEFTLEETTPDAEDPLTETKSVEYEAAETGEKTIPFSEITYSEVGDYTYTITEGDVAKGWTTEGSPATVTVSVTDGGEGKLVATVDGDKVITNTYDVKPVEVKTAEGTPFFKKIVVGEDFEEKTFDFTLEAVDGAPVDKTSAQVTTDEAGEFPIDFGTIKYEKAGTYTYKVQETTESGYGWTCNNDVKTVTVNVEINDEGTALVATVTGQQVSNAYETTSTDFDTTEMVTKTVVGSDFEEKTFDFTLEYGEGSPEASGGTAAQVTATEAGDYDIDFGTITFTKVGEYDYTVTETTEDGYGWTKSDSPATVTVVVTVNEDGELEATVEGATITNTYETTPTTVVTKTDGFLNKKVVGSDFEEKTFDFTLEGKDGAPTDETSAQVTADEAGEFAVDFGEIEFTKVGTFTYSVEETTADGYGWTKSNSPATVTVEVTVDEEGALQAEVKGATITNTYETTPTTVVTKTDGFLNKKVVGSDFDPKTFDFTLAGEPNAGTAASIEATEAGEFPIDFGEIEFTKVGTFTYSVEETTADGYGWTKSDSPAEVTVEVTVNEKGELQAEVTGGTITNTYETTPITVVTTDAETTFATKKVEGEGFDPKTFDFTLEAKDGAPIDKTSAQVEATEAGEFPVDFGTIEYDKVGTFAYTLDETTETGSSWLCDESTPTVTVEVTVDEEGALQAEVTGATLVNKYAHITMTKTTTSTPANGSTYALGETIVYKITATNDGAADLSGITVIDELTGFEQADVSLAAGESKDFTTSYTVTEDDILAGKVVNEVTAESDDPSDPGIDPGTKEDPTDELDTTLTVVKEITNKPAEGDAFTPGESIEYKITVTNDGNVTYNNVVVTDELTGDEWTIESLAPGESKVFNAAYKVTEADVTTGSVTNKAVAKADPIPDPSDPDNPKTPEGEGVTPPAPVAASIVLIEYDPNGGIGRNGTEIYGEKHRIGDEITIIEAPTREGYKFLYWKGSEYQPGDKYTVEGYHLFVAQWEPVAAPAETKTIMPQTGDNIPVTALVIVSLLLLGLVLVAVRKMSRSER